jgi:hypothetical protein
MTSDSSSHKTIAITRSLEPKEKLPYGTSHLYSTSNGSRIVVHSHHRTEEEREAYFAKLAEENS